MSVTTVGAGNPKSADLSIGNLINSGWALYKRYWKEILSIAFVYWLISFVIGRAAMAVVDSEILYYLIYIIGQVVSLLMSIGIIVAGLKVCRGEMPEVKDLWSHTSKFLNYFLVSVVYGLIVFAGTILLIIPGIYFAIKYAFAAMLAVDKNMGVGDALKASAAMTQGIKLKLMWVGFVISLFSALGLLALGVGLVLTVPTAMLAMYLIYIRLLPSANLE